MIGGGVTDVQITTTEQNFDHVSERETHMAAP